MNTGTGQGNAGIDASGSTSMASGSMGLDRTRCVHADLVRSVALGEEFVLSGSYDLSIKVNSFSFRLFIRGADWCFPFRFGRGRLGNSSLILREDIQAGYFVLVLIVPRSVLLT